RGNGHGGRLGPSPRTFREAPPLARLAPAFGDSAGARPGILLAQSPPSPVWWSGDGPWAFAGGWAVAAQPSLSFAGLLRQLWGQLRAEATLTQEELAEAAGLSPRSVSDLERGINRTARKDTALLLAGALGLAGPAGELFVAAARGKVPASEVLAVARGAVPLPRGMITSPYRGLGVFEEQDAGL